VIRGKILKDDIIIRKSILHILNSEIGQIGLASNLIDMQPELLDMIRDHVFKIFDNDERIHCKLQKNTPVGEMIEKLNEKDDQSFIDITKNLSERLFDIMCDSVEIPAADLLCASFQVNGNIYLALLKMNYKRTYTHYQGTDDVTDIIKQNAISSGKLTEAVIFDLANEEDIYLIQKKYMMLNGEKCNYLSERFLICQADDLSPKKKFQVLNKTVSDIINKDKTIGLKKQLDTKKAFYDRFSDDGMFDINKIGSELFGKDKENMSEFDLKMERYNLQYDKFSVIKESTVNKLNYLEIETDMGIIVKIPAEVFNRTNINIEESKMNGTSAITIDNIEAYRIKP